MRVTLLLPGKVATGMSQAAYAHAIEPGAAARIAFDAVAARRPVAFTRADRIPEVERRFAAIVADGRPRCAAPPAVRPAGDHGGAAGQPVTPETR